MGKRITLITALLLSTMIFLNSCKKDDDTAYQPAGNYGNANLVSSQNFVLNDWTVVWNDGANYVYTSTIAWPSITQDILDNGVIMAYWKSSDQWIALPYSYAANGFSDSRSFVVGLGDVKIELMGYSSTGPNPASYYVGETVRIVAVSAKVVAAHPNTNWSNYNEVQQVLQLSNQ
jgi:hypothetical protein